MTDEEDANDNFALDETNSCYFFHFGLIVTGEAERHHLPKIFKSLEATGICTFKVIPISDRAWFTGQRRPITSDKRKLRMVGSGQIIPDNDAMEIGFPARKYLENDPCRRVIMVDDLEPDWRTQAQQVFDRYRLIFDTILAPRQRHRAFVHLLVNMLEAYYLADANAINLALHLNPPTIDYPDDVEEIPNPKGMLKSLYIGFNEVEDGGRILDNINIEHVLSNPDTCAWLRTLFAWCMKVLKQYPDCQSLSLPDNYRLHDGVMSSITQVQLSRT